MGNKGGFITLHRQILDWEWYRDGNTKDLFLHLLLTANYADTMVKGRLIRRGQVTSSLTKLAHELGQTVRMVRVSLNHLVMTGEVTNESSPEGRIITVVKYDDYQSYDKPSDKQMTNIVTNQVTNDVTNKRQTERQTKGQTYNNNINNINNNNKTTNTTKITKESLSLFDVFWAAYPRHVAKQAALAAWKKLKPDGGMLDRKMEGLARWKASDEWQREDGRYIPHPASWLNGRRWEDEMRQRPSVAAKPAKVVQAQQYGQRDYGKVQDDLLDRQHDEFSRMIEEMRREGTI